jgi:hypothetical protein
VRAAARGARSGDADVHRPLAAAGIGADMGADSSAKVDWCKNTHNFDQILAGAQRVAPHLAQRAAAAVPAGCRPSGCAT